MPIARICTRCARLVQRTTRGLCPACEMRRTRERAVSEPWRRVYSDPRWQGVRALAMRAAGFRCQAMTDGVRCDVRTGLEAHHVVALRRGGAPFDLANVVALCPHHHRMAERASA